jgi:hypothetical protein
VPRTLTQSVDEAALQCRRKMTLSIGPCQYARNSRGAFQRGLSGTAPGPQRAQSRTTTQRARTLGVPAGSGHIGNRHALSIGIVRSSAQARYELDLGRGTGPGTRHHLDRCSWCLLRRLGRLPRRRCSSSGPEPRRSSWPLHGRPNYYGERGSVSKASPTTLSRSAASERNWPCPCRQSGSALAQSSRTLLHHSEARALRLRICRGRLGRQMRRGVRMHVSLRARRCPLAKCAQVCTGASQQPGAIVRAHMHVKASDADRVSTGARARVNVLSVLGYAHTAWCNSGSTDNSAVMAAIFTPSDTPIETRRAAGCLRSSLR